VWRRQVRLTSSVSEAQAVAALDEQCNDETRRDACVIFMETSEMRSVLRGVPVLLRVLQQPFVLVTADNTDECVPFKVSRGGGEGVSSFGKKGGGDMSGRFPALGWG
jgi:hypothetical protein